MIDLIPARAEMADLIDLNPAQLMFGTRPDRAALQTAIDAGLAFAVIDGDRVVAIGGVRNVWQDRGIAWGLLASGIGATMVPITRAVRRFLSVCPTRRIEAEVAADHEEGRRWIEMLGFEREGRMRAYWGGKDFDLYARVRD
jgi:hypothetical protein